MDKKKALKGLGVLAIIAIGAIITHSALADVKCTGDYGVYGEGSNCTYDGARADASLARVSGGYKVCAQLSNPKNGWFATGTMYNSNKSKLPPVAVTQGASVCSSNKASATYVLAQVTDSDVE